MSDGVIVSCYLMMLLLLVGLGIGRGQRQVFEMSAVTGELFSRRSLQNQATLGNVYTVSAQLRPCVGSHCGQNDNTTACSTPSCSVRVQSIPLVSNTTLSTPYDASFTHSGIRPVTIMSPPSPLFQAPVTVGSNEGVTNTLHKTADTLV